MKATTSWAAFVAGIFLVVCVAGLGQRLAMSSQTDDARTIQTLDEQWATAETKHDKAFLEHVLDDRFVITDDEGTTEN
jgi:hypothetical protein